MVAYQGTYHLTRKDFMALEDRSAFLGPIRTPGTYFRCNFNMFCGAKPDWALGTFVIDQKEKAKFDAIKNKPVWMLWRGEDIYVKTVWYRVKFIDGEAPEHTVRELKHQLARYSLRV